MSSAPTPGPPHVVIVGGGLAGLRTAERLRRLGHPGRITLVGAETRRAYDRPPLSKACLTAPEVPEAPLLRSAETYAELDLDLRLGVAATSIDTEEQVVTLGDGSMVRYDELVLATGARARTVPAWSQVPGVHTLRTFDDCLELRAAFASAGRSRSSVLVVGAGVLGCEVTAAARVRGLAVDLVDVAGRPLARVVHPTVGDAVADLHRTHGVRLHLGTAVASLEPGSDGPVAHLEHGLTVRPGVVVVAVGSVAETGWLAGSGVVCDDGVVCDASGATTAPHVWAVGDVARSPRPEAPDGLRLEHWTAAGDSAAAVAARVLGQEPPVLDDVPYVWSDQYDVKLQTLGLPDPTDALTVVSGSIEERRFLALLDRDGTVTGAVGMGMPAPLARCRGAVAAGESLTELVERAPWERRSVTT